MDKRKVEAAENVIKTLVADISNGLYRAGNTETIKAATEPYGIYDVDDDFVAKTKLVDGALWDYGKGATLYGWHISNLKIYDVPLELMAFRKPELPTGLRYEEDAIKRPPQSWCYVEEQ